MNTRAIQIENIDAAYRETPVLHDLTLTIEPGELLGILGPNGAGKSTLFRVLTGLHKPSGGSVRIFGRDIFSIKACDRARLIGVVPQTIETPVAFTVEEMVMMGHSSILGRWSSPTAEDRRAVERALVYTDVVALRKRPVTALSGGERQRAVVAMVLAQEPRIILMDEATSHLDINHRFEIMQLIERLNTDHGVTAIIISHDLNLAADFCRRLILLDHGRIAADGQPGIVLTGDLLRQVYHCEINVQQDPQSGLVNVAPARRRPGSMAGHGIKVHVIAGGGTGEELMRHLALCGYGLSAGVLNQGDNDTATAQALGIQTALEKPFSPVGADALVQAREMAALADVIVLTDVPFGPGNLPNLDLLDEALPRNCRVLVLAGIDQRDYTPGHQAAQRIRNLLAHGAVECRDIAELVSHLPLAKA